MSEATAFARSAVGFLTILALACGPGELPSEEILVEKPDGYGLHLEVAPGTWTDGSGAVGLALLVTLRDAEGRGPESAWKFTLADESGKLPIEGIYDAPELGSHGAYWWPDFPVAFSQRYWLIARDAEGHELSRSFISTGKTIKPAELLLSGGSLTWERAYGAHAYACEARSGNALALRHTAVEPGCDLSALPAGSYSGTVLGYSKDLAEISANTEARPPLPPSFNVSEARLAFTLGAGGHAELDFRSAGGAIHYGTSQPGLAVWVALGGAAQVHSAWTVSVTGPGISGSAPASFYVTPQSARTLVWFYDVPASLGSYAVTAEAGATTLQSSFRVAGAVPLELPSGLTLDNGGAQPTARWSAVAEARSYLLSTWDQSTGERVGAKWTNKTEAGVPGDELVSGATYDVYVAAASIDMTQESNAFGVRVSEDAYKPVSFTAK